MNVSLNLVWKSLWNEPIYWQQQYEKISNAIHVKQFDYIGKESGIRIAIAGEIDTVLLKYYRIHINGGYKPWRNETGRKECFTYEIFLQRKFNLVGSVPTSRLCCSRSVSLGYIPRYFSLSYYQKENIYIRSWYMSSGNPLRTHPTRVGFEKHIFLCFSVIWFIIFLSNIKQLLYTIPLDVMNPTQNSIPSDNVSRLF